MSRLIKKRICPEHEQEYIAELRCDICGRAAPHPEDSYPWSDGMYEVHDVVIELREGTQYPEGGAGEETSFDICPECFKECLIPVLFAMGAQPRKKNWEC